MRFSPRFSPLSALCGAVLLISLALPLPNGGAILNLPSPCPFFGLTGWPCPLCGMTRAFVCCAHGQLLAAFGWHPLGPLWFAATLFCFALALFGLKIPPFSPRVWKFGALLFALVWALRLGGIWPLPTA